MNIAIITGSAGLIGSEAVRFFSKKGFKCVGIDNDMRKTFFGEEASTSWNKKLLIKTVPDYEHQAKDIRDAGKMKRIFNHYGSDIKLVVHTAAQPSHDWAATDPFTDFSINANGTLVMLETTRKYCPNSVFIYTSTNKVYGDAPNSLPFIEQETRWELPSEHPYYSGINETMSIDASTHSLFGSSKTAADILVQEYGRYFGMKTGVFRAGCLTGPYHSGTQSHGFLSYLVECALSNRTYSVFGYRGKQVRDNMHAYDLITMFWHFYQNPKKGAVYNTGGSRHAHCSLKEAVTLCEKILGTKIKTNYFEQNRIGDHMWWISDISKFQSHYPEWKYQYSLEKTILQIADNMKTRKKKLRFSSRNSVQP